MRLRDSEVGFQGSNDSHEISWCLMMFNSHEMSILGSCFPDSTDMGVSNRVMGIEMGIEDCNMGILHDFTRQIQSVGL